MINPYSKIINYDNVLTLNCQSQLTSNFQPQNMSYRCRHMYFIENIIHVI
jgi:hypothetical protein